MMLLEGAIGSRFSFGNRSLVGMSGGWMSAATSGICGTGPGYRCAHPGYRFVIASEAKQSISPRKERMDCFVASAFARRRASAGKSAPRNDGTGCGARYEIAMISSS